VITERAAIQKKLFEGFASSLAAAVESSAGLRPDVSIDFAAAAPGTGGLVWKQPLPPLGGAAWAAISEVDWKAAGQRMLAAAGTEDAPEAALKSTFLEVLGQALPAWAQTLTAILGREVTCAGGGESGDSLPPAIWAAIELSLDATRVTLALGVEPGVIDSLAASLQDQPAESAKIVAAPAANGVPAAPGSKTFDLLLDVELPVSVSFGRAQVPLKDVLKLTTGSIVELNRAVVEPVDIVINNRVIARGEVVVVEGNFGVRIQQVVSPHERLRTLE